MYFRALILPLLVILSGCVSPVVTDSRDGVDYGRYQQFAISPQQPGDTRSLDQQRAEAALQQALSARGFNLVEAEQAEALAIYFFKPEQRFQGSTMQFGFGVIHGPVGFGTSTPVQGETINEHRLVVQLVDANSKQVFWQGTGRHNLSDEMSSERRQKLIERAVSEMFKRYPPS